MSGRLFSTPTIQGLEVFGAEHLQGLPAFKMSQDLSFISISRPFEVDYYYRTVVFSHIVPIPDTRLRNLTGSHTGERKGSGRCPHKRLLKERRMYLPMACWDLADGIRDVMTGEF